MCIPFLSRRPGILPEIRNIRVRKVIGEAIEMYRFGWSGGNGRALHFAALKREPARKEGLVLVTVRGQVTKAITRDSTWNSLIFRYGLPYSLPHIYYLITTTTIIMGPLVGLLI